MEQTVSGLAFLWLCLGKTNRCSHVAFMRVSNVLGMLLCIRDGSEYVFCCLDVVEFSCRVVLCFCIALPFPDDDVNSRSDSRREESLKGSTL